MSLAHKQSSQSTKPSLSALASGRSLNSSVPGTASDSLPRSSFSGLAAKGLGSANRSISQSSNSIESAEPKPNHVMPSKLSLLLRAKGSHTVSSPASSDLPLHTKSSYSPSILTHSSITPQSPGYSKLALRIRDKLAISQASSQTMDQLPSELPPLFRHSPSPMQALPSPFALLLVSRSTSHSPSTTLSSPGIAKAFALSDGETSFTFNAPSPDDIILSARSGTALVSRIRRI